MTATAPIQQWIDRARQQKAFALAMQLIREGATEDAVMAMMPDEWKALCARAGVKNMPSAETMSLVLLEVRQANQPLPELSDEEWRRMSA